MDWMTFLHPPSPRLPGVFRSPKAASPTPPAELDGCLSSLQGGLTPFLSPVEAKGQLVVWGPAPSPAHLIHLCKAAVHFPRSPTRSARLCWVKMEAGPGTGASSSRTHPAGLPLSLQGCTPSLQVCFPQPRWFCVSSCTDRYRRLRHESGSRS